MALRKRVFLHALAMLSSRLLLYVHSVPSGLVFVDRMKVFFCCPGLAASLAYTVFLGLSSGGFSVTLPTSVEKDVYCFTFFSATSPEIEFSLYIPTCDGSSPVP